MKILYLKLAADGIRKNKRLYLPYILTGCVMVAVHYILAFLSESPSLDQMRGGDVIRAMLPLGKFVVYFFSVIFLFYTNAFLLRQRNREFGLFNVLGMGKRNIGRIMVWDGLVTGLSAMGGGLLLGALFSKLAETVLLNLVGFQVSFQLNFGIRSVIQTLILFGILYVLLLIHALYCVWKLKPLELLQSSSAGEKPPKVHWMYALAGLVILMAAYYLAVTIEDAVEALFLFFVAVLMVIAATYLLFIAGSVVFCRLLQKNKGYYYRANHFVSVSSMVYRMRRNGAGLASICILSTMVLVAVSTTVSLYIGMEDNLRGRYPFDVNVELRVTDPSYLDETHRTEYRRVMEDFRGGSDDHVEYRAVESYALFADEGIYIDMRTLPAGVSVSYNQSGMLQIVALDDYNRFMGTNETLEEDECLIHCERMRYPYDTVTIIGGNSYKVKGKVAGYFKDGTLSSMLTSSVCVIVKDINRAAAPMLEYKTGSGDQSVMLKWKYGFNLDTDSVSKIAAGNGVKGRLQEMLEAGESGIRSRKVEIREAERQEFRTMYGSLLFLGVLLSIVFCFAMVLIIYYKQISEGYEDQSRFGIMRKVGMTKGEIRKSINSQILTVFFLPLLFAGLHLCFAFPFLWKILMLFGLLNLTLLIWVNVIGFLIFGVFYAAVYKLTAGVYYRIVSR